MANKKRFDASGVVAVYGRREVTSRTPISSRVFVSMVHFVGIALASLALTLMGCGSSSTGGSASAPRIFHLEGTVISVDKAKQQLVIDHKAIPGLMSAMTMGYPVGVDDLKMLDEVGPGDQITAEVVVDDNGARLRNIVIVKKGTGAAAAPVAMKQPDAGNAADVVPDFTLLNQDGKQIDLKQYRGKALLITFIYTRCPVASECPLTTHSFAEVEKGLAKNPALYASTHLLTVSFDPQYDTPAVLRNYARGFGQSAFEHWEFASLPASETREATKFFGIFVSEQQGQINHSTCTAIISPDGSLYRLYPSSDWKPQTALADLAGVLARSGATPTVARSTQAPDETAAVR